MSSWREDRGTGRKKETDNRKTDRRRFFKSNSSGKTTAKKKTTGRTGTKKTAAKRKKEAGILEPALKKELVILITLRCFRSFILQQSGNLRSLRQTAS